MTDLHNEWEREVAHYLDAGLGLEAAWHLADASVPGHDSDTCPVCTEEDAE